MGVSPNRTWTPQVVMVVYGLKSKPAKRKPPSDRWLLFTLQDLAVASVVCRMILYLYPVP